MTANELYIRLNEKIPPELSCEWDNDGLMCCSDGNMEIHKALVALDVTEEVIERARLGGFDLIISHHPFIFKGLTSINGDNFVARRVIDVIKSDITVMSFHTRLDTVEGGVNDTLASLLGLQNAAAYGEGGMGRIGEVEKTTLEEFAKGVKRALGSSVVLCADGGRPVRRVAVLGGGGASFISSALEAGADTFISGDIGYHNLTDSIGRGINLLECGHFFTENPVCTVLCRMLSDIAPEIETEIFVSNRTRAV